MIVSIKLFRTKLYKALLHHHETTLRIEKLEALKEHTANLASIKNGALYIKFNICAPKKYASKMSVYPTKPLHSLLHRANFMS